MRNTLFPLLLLAACGGAPEDPSEVSAAVDPDPGDGTVSPPGPNDIPSAPFNFGILERTSSSVRFQWQDASAYETGNYVERRIGSATTWTTIASLGVRSGVVGYTDTGRAGDTLHCYRIRASNLRGSSYSPTRCAYTRPAVAHPVWRVQLRVEVADVSDAGTDDGMTVRLDSTSMSTVPYGNRTGLDRPGDDLERNSDYTYDLDMAAIGDLGDITQIHLSKPGSDGLCLEGLTLIVNGVPVYRRYFGNTSSTCWWMDDSIGHVTSYVVSFGTLRAASTWSGYVQPLPPLFLSRDEIERRIEGLVGNAIFGNGDVQWGHISGRAVEVTEEASNRIHVDLDLSGSSIFPDPAIDVDLSITIELVQASDGTWRLEITSGDFTVDVDYALWVDITGALLSPLCGGISTLVTGEARADCVSDLEGYIAQRILAAWTPIAMSFNVGRLPCPNGPLAEVGADGSISFGCR